MEKEPETIDVDVLFVGAGPANLAGAYHLCRLIDDHNRAVEKGEKKGEKLQDLTIAVIEKAGQVGAHGFSGAVMDPIALKEFMPDYKDKGAPIEKVVEKDYIYVFTKSAGIRLPFAPPPMQNHGNLVISLSKFTQWMAGLLDSNRVMLFTEFAGAKPIYEGDRVVGVRTGEKGIGKKGQKKSSYDPGTNIRAKVTILGEGPLGPLTRQVVDKFKLNEGRMPISYATGVKEVWQLPKGRIKQGWVLHSMGWPHPFVKNDSMGGGWVYTMDNDQLSVGFVTWLDYRNPYTDPHRLFQLFKTHPTIKALLKDAELVQYGAKTVPVSGYWSVPKLYADGVMIVGDSAGMCNGMRLKGVHIAIKSGMLAAETALGALVKKDFGAATLRGYEEAVHKSWIWKELHKARNFHQVYHHGMLVGLVRTGIQTALGGRDLFGDRIDAKADRAYMNKKLWYKDGGGMPEIKFDNKYLCDKMTDIYNSGTTHEEDQPSHLVVADLDLCENRCTKEYGNPCQYFCPAQVYEPRVEEGGKFALHLNPSNCVHCKTCDIKDPYNNILWVPPEGGGGPKYTVL
ncbi:MAG: electron transfer flavoprotein-ubiquinone oxidoreductase [Nitrospirae bacterium]|nr:electron transfer flavoprotein-ubiquinone oxidoreductase [Nitrospirota bacterium]